MVKAIWVHKSIYLSKGDFPDKTKVHPIFKCLWRRTKGKLKVSGLGYICSIFLTRILYCSTKPLQHQSVFHGFCLEKAREHELYKRKLSPERSWKHLVLVQWWWWWFHRINWPFEKGKQIFGSQELFHGLKNKLYIVWQCGILRNLWRILE